MKPVAFDERIIHVGPRAIEHITCAKDEVYELACLFERLEDVTRGRIEQEVWQQLYTARKDSNRAALLLCEALALFRGACADVLLALVPKDVLPTLVPKEVLSVLVPGWEDDE